MKSLSSVFTIRTPTASASSSMSSRCFRASSQASQFGASTNYSIQLLIDKNTWNWCSWKPKEIFFFYFLHRIIFIWKKYFLGKTFSTDQSFSVLKQINWFLRLSPYEHSNSEFVCLIGNKNRLKCYYKKVCFDLHTKTIR